MALSKKLSAALIALRNTDSFRGEDPELNPPPGYRQTTPEERNQWNDFVRYLYSKGIAGKKELDIGEDKTAQLMNEYKKVNPNFSLTPDDVKRIQYEIAMMQRGKVPVGGKFISSKDNPYLRFGDMLFSGRKLSKIDGRIGSLTSMEAYPHALYTKEGKVLIDANTDYDKYLRMLDSLKANAAAISDMKISPSVYKMGMRTNVKGD